MIITAHALFTTSVEVELEVAVELKAVRSVWLLGLPLVNRSATGCQVL